MKYVAITPDKDEAEVTLTASRQAPAGRTLYVIVAGTNRAGGAATVKQAPAIPVKILPGPTSGPATRPASLPATRPAKPPKP